ncbi:hypothetical protein BU23DRAFT_628427 [Bimuria novae-zelandiae CBS 107.79]|uniref:Uncharacterized protein n=1 Tax=Bimuria novae-zelandiae CBS 107.79 TaxID=1447943 RepID=A0A6A5VP22_9PLEO|nr:hypothetical protein BU23DRAFT_628427 [Bimuria novae-zelandiae CBS 107.79]
MASEPRTITIRDFLTDKHGFTLPASRLGSYNATLKHTSSSLFRHPKAFTMHLHASVHENDCETPLEKNKWERGEYFKEGQITLWAHFVRIPGVDLFGESLEKLEENKKDEERAKKRWRHEFPERSKQEMTIQRPQKEVDESHGRRIKKAKVLEGYGLPPQPSKPNKQEHFSKYAKIASLPKENAGNHAECAKTAPPFAGFQDSIAASAHNASASAVEKRTSIHQGQRPLSESPLFETDVQIKQEMPEYSSEDEGGIEWDDGCC